MVNKLFFDSQKINFFLLLLTLSEADRVTSYSGEVGRQGMTKSLPNELPTDRT